jgi:hypothetical protein
VPGHGIKDHQQVQIDISDIHGMDFIYPHHPLYKFRAGS